MRAVKEQILCIGGVKVALDAGDNINAHDSEGYAALHEAVWNANGELIEFLIAQEAKIDIKNKKDETPLCLARIKDRNSEPAATILMAKKADVHVRDNEGNSLLHHATHHQNLEIAEMLVKTGVDVNDKRNDGKMPSGRYPEVTEFLERVRREQGKAVELGNQEQAP